MTASGGDGVARLTLLDALAYGPQRWDGLAASLRVPSPFMRWAWHHAWAQSAPSAELQASFAVILHGPEGCLRGLLPLTIRPMQLRRARVRALTWAIGGLGCPDHLDIPTAPEAELQAAIPLLEALPWDVIVLSAVSEEPTNLAQLTEAFARRGYAVRRTPLDACPYVDLPSSWEEYLASLSPTRRQTIRRKERKLMRDYTVTVTDYAPDRLDEGWRRLCSLHEARWTGAGALGDPRLRDLLRRFSAELAARGELWLTTLDLDGEPAAAWHGFAWGDTVYFYQGGRDLQRASESVGLVLMGAMIRRAIDRGYRRFDFLRGRDAYKLSWASTERAIYEVLIFRPGWRGAWLRGLDLAGRVRARIRSRPEFASSSEE
ncbi:MAG: GNAT family N-acetyltransferase [Gemmatimonadota bacterium]|nr:GNAT family N-acetyltransferase [Gemmatimonadota bacterium]